MDDMRVKMRYQKEMQSLFVKYKVNPFRSLMMPFVQLPIFISFFFGLKEMGTYFPALATGGAYWFTDLSAADPYMIFPVANAVSFLLMVEMGSDGLQTSQQQTFKWGMRGLAVTMAPLTMSIPQVCPSVRRILTVGL
jgi:YidC/Oxa1 family membrane protein insertase